MTIEKLLSNINYNIKKIVDELRKRIADIKGVDESINDRYIRYTFSGEDFCMFKIRQDYLEIDFKADKVMEDPMGFSWKIKPNKDNKFNRRMQIKNMRDIDTVFGLIFQSYNGVKG